MKQLPKPSKLTLAMIGPGIVLVAMGLGSGEFVLWPYLVAQYGFGIMWGAIVGITFQYFVSSEAARYTLSTGNSVYVGFAKLAKWLPWWFILSTYFSFAWPGIIASGGQVLGYLFSVEDHKFITIFLLIVIGLILTLGGQVYNNVERLQKIFLLVTIPILFVIAFIVADLEITANLAKGVVGIGEGYNFLPTGISIMSFLGAVAYSGAAGNLVLSHSFYVQDEGHGMARYTNSQLNLKQKQMGLPDSFEFVGNEINVRSFKRWFSNVSTEQFISFWLTGTLTIFLLVIISYALVYPFDGEEGLRFIFEQGELLKEKFSDVVGVFFLLVGAIFLFTTQLGVFEATSRIMMENLQIASKSVREKFSRRTIFFGFLWAQIVFAIIISFLEVSQPLQILILGTFFSAVSMFVLSGTTLWLNNSKQLNKHIHPGFIRNAAMAISFVFFGVFVGITVWDLVVG